MLLSTNIAQVLLRRETCTILRHKSYAKRIWKTMTFYNVTTNNYSKMCHKNFPNSINTFLLQESNVIAISTNLGYKIMPEFKIFCRNL